MEDSRPNPQGFFSRVKSLFISPRYVPDIELRFFEAGDDYFQQFPRGRPALRNYSPFYRETTRCIYFDIYTTLLLDSGGLCSSVVREAELIVEAIEK